MKSISPFIFLIVFFIVGCANTETDIQEGDEAISIDNELNWSQGLGKSPEEFVSNWNKLIDSISNDQDTITFFSIDPDGIYQVSTAKETFVYQFGSTENIFVLNLNVSNNVVNAIEFFSPTSTDEITSQQTKLFFLMIISISDDSLDKDERETVLVDLGLYEELLDPNEYGGTTLKNQIQYEIEPIVVENQMVGINFYTRILSE